MREPLNSTSSVPDVDAFLAEVFASSAQNKAAISHSEPAQGPLLHFGSGPNKCIGQFLAMTLMKAFLAPMIRRAELATSEDLTRLNFAFRS